MGISAKTDLQAQFLPGALDVDQPVAPPYADARLVHCDVVFGSPRSDCNGAGICKIVDINSGQHLLLKRSCRLAPALLTADATGQVLTMNFLRGFMCAHLLRHHFRTGVLEVQDACPIPERVVETLGLCGASILPGRYRIEERARGFAIYFYV